MTAYESCLRTESIICNTSTAWGLFPFTDPKALFLFWILRHAIYLVCVFFIATRANFLFVPLVAFFLYVHIHKAVLFLRNAKQAQENSDEVSIREKYEPTQSVDSKEKLASSQKEALQEKNDIEAGNA